MSGNSKNLAARDKYLKWSKGDDKSNPKRHTGSAAGHQRKARIARAKKQDPKLIEQLKKDLKYEMENSSLSLLQKLRSAETASKCLGAMILRNFIVRALFRQTARAFYKLLTKGVDHSTVAQLKQTVTIQKETRNDGLEELDELRMKVEDFELAALKQRTTSLAPIIARYCRQLKKLGLKLWSEQIFAEKRRIALQTRAASYFANRQARMAFEEIRNHCDDRMDARSQLISMGTNIIKCVKKTGFDVFKENTVGNVSAMEQRDITNRLEEQVQYLSLTLLVSAIRRNHNNAKTKALYMWRELAATERRMELILKRATKKLRYKILNKWYIRIKAFAVHSKQRKAALRRVCRSTEKRLLNKGTKQWMSWVKEEKEIEGELDYQRKLMLRILSHLAQQTLSQGFRCWTDMLREYQRRDKIMARAGARMKNRRINSAMRSWLSFVVARKHVRVLANRVFGRIVRGKLMMGWYSWQSYLKGLDSEVAEKERIERIMTRIAAKMKNRTVSAALDTWIELVSEAKRMKHLLKKTAARMKNKKISAAMRSWLDFVVARKHVRALANRVFGRIARGKLMMGWYSWQSYLKGLDAEGAEKERHERIMKKIAAKMKNRTVSAALDTWIELVSESKRMKHLLKKTAARMKNRQITAAFLTWQTYWTQMRYERALAWKVLSRLANAKVSSAFNSWWADVKEQKRHGRIMGKIAAKMKNRTISSALDKWIEMVSEAKQMRLLLKRAAARMMRRAVVQTFERWVESVEEIKIARGRLQRAVTKFKNRLASSAFVMWKETAAEAKRHRILLKRVALKIKNRTVSAALSSWTSYVIARQDARTLCTRVMKRMCNVKVYAAWRVWVTAVTDYKKYIKLLQKTRGRMMNRLISAAWTTWIATIRDAKRIRHLLKKTALKIKNRVISTCFSTWYEAVQQNKSNKNAVNRAVKMWSNRTYSMVFNTWYENVAEMVRNRRIVKKIAAKMKNRVIATALATWQDFTAERQHMRRLVRKVLGRLLNSKMQAAWRTWLKRLELLRWEDQMASLSGDEQQAMRDRKLWEENRAKAIILEQQKKDRAILRVLARVQMRGVILTFDAWLSCTVESLRIKTLLRRTATKIAKKALFNSFECWFESVQDKKENRLKVKRCLIRIRNRVLVVVIDTWVSRIQERKNNQVIVARCLKKIKNRKLDGAYNAWLDFTDTRIHQRWLIGRVMGRLLNSKLVAGWQKWCDTVRRLRAMENDDEDVLTPAEKQCKRVLTRMLNNLTSSAWEAWTSYTNEHRRLEHLLKRVAAKWKNKLLSATFDGWYDAAATLRQHRVLVARAAAKWKMRAAAACFSTWSSKSKQAKMDRVRVARCLQKIKNRALDSAFQGWANNVDEILQLRQRMKKAAMKMKNRKAAMAFGTWIDMVDEVKRIRNLLKKAAQKMHMRAAALAFARWSGQWSDRQTVRKLLIAITGRKTKSMVSLSWNCWKTFVTVLKSQGEGSMCPRCERIVFKTEAELARLKAIADKEKNWNKSTVGAIPGSMDAQILESGGSTVSGSPSGSGLRGVRALQQSSKLSMSGNLNELESSIQPGQQMQQSEESQKEVNDLRMKSKRAAREAQTLRDRLKRVQAQYELRLQITLTRAEEQQHQMQSIIHQQRTDLENMQEQYEQNKQNEILKNTNIVAENLQLNKEILKKQKLLERSIAQRHAIEESLVSMNRKWRDKGRTSEDTLDEVFNRVSAGLSTVMTPGRAQRSQWRVSADEMDENVEESKRFIAQLKSEKLNIEQMNSNLSNRLQESQLLVEEYEEESERLKQVNSATVAEMTELAIAHNITQHQKIASLASTVTELQSQLDEAHKSGMVQMQAKELELGHCRNALRSKEFELKQLTRSYDVAKLEAKSSIAAGAMEMSRVLSPISRVLSPVDGGSSILPRMSSTRPSTATGTRESHQQRRVRVGSWIDEDEAKRESEVKEKDKEVAGPSSSPTFLSREAYLAMIQNQ